MQGLEDMQQNASVTEAQKYMRTAMQGVPDQVEEAAEVHDDMVELMEQVTEMNDEVAARPIPSGIQEDDVRGGISVWVMSSFGTD